MRLNAFSTCLASLALAGCGHVADIPVEAASGPAPQIVEPAETLLPTFDVAPATGWPDGAAPVPAQGMAVTSFATGLDHPRWLHVLPNGDVLVAESAAPPQPELGKGIKGFFMKLFMKKAGSAVPSANRITLLRDTDGDGVADMRAPFITELNSPFGMALVGSDLYVANTDAVLRFRYETGATSIPDAGETIAVLPAGPYNQHWTRSLAVSPDNTKLYVAIGSASNIGEYGLEHEVGRAAIREIDLRTGAERLFASGLRNPVGMAFEPESNRLWTAVNERDELGSDVPPDYMTAVEDGGFYGWPYSYWGDHVDERVEPGRPDLVASALVPDYALGPHTASLGLAFTGSAHPAPLGLQGAFIGQHGSWNRKPPSGYKVVFVPFAEGRPSGPVYDILTGFLSADGEAYGRPVGVALDGRGGLLVADDVGNTVWRVSDEEMPGRAVQ
ncbi:PQQ-dependent sugar dehydrogenase [Croceicoccus marinus]|uniref:Sorbosone dehydrogenase n=1 Tax=Croceicoccus marinus TaxID=450378 RepID=A0A217EYQ7_9SPHN|nr:sorbosone dehydrogenase family protein [Croceicoccus marinus]ARU18260.1 sorbosone dehydrogenase [Croceicoccus marinus]